MMLKLLHQLTAHFPRTGGEELTCTSPNGKVGVGNRIDTHHLAGTLKTIQEPKVDIRRLIKPELP
jgi:hypothetical protein